MTDKEREALRKALRVWTNERITSAASIGKSEYKPETLEMMFAELGRRGLPNSSEELQKSIAAARSAEAHAERSRHNTLLFPAQLNRKQYLLRWVAWALPFIFIAYLIELFVPRLQPWAALAWIVTALIYKIAGLDIPRLRNSGDSPWLAVCQLVPGLGLIVVVLLFVLPPEKRN